MTTPENKDSINYKDSVCINFKRAKEMKKNDKKIDKEIFNEYSTLKDTINKYVQACQNI